MRDYETIAAEYAAAKKAYHDAADGPTGKQAREASDKIEKLYAEMSASIADGAKSCECGTTPHGMATPRVVDKIPVTLYEVGCKACDPPRRARAFSPAAAVARWNADDLSPPKEG